MNHVEPTSEVSEPAPKPLRKRSWRMRWSLRALVGVVTLACLLLAYANYLIRVGRTHEDVGRQLAILEESGTTYLRHRPEIAVAWQYEVETVEKVPYNIHYGTAFSRPIFLIRKVKGVPEWMERTGSGLMFQRIDTIRHGDQLPDDKFDELIQQITRLDRMRALEFDSAIHLQQLTQDDLAIILANVHVDNLRAPRCHVETTPFPELRRSGLRELDLSHSRFSDASLADLPSSLRKLDLERTAITDKGLKGITRLRYLSYLDLRRTPTSKPAIDRLKESLPDCVILWEPLDLP